MDLSSLIGMVFGVILVIVGIFWNEGVTLTSAMIFLNLPSFVITIGGTIAAIIASFPFSTFKYMGKHMGIIFGKNKYNPREYITIIGEFAQDARRKGILSLEDKVNEQEDVFLKKSIMLIIDAIEPAKAKLILENELDNLDSRHGAGVKLYEKASSLAPAFGMIGTLIGLIVMLGDLNLSADGGAEKLTGGMAVALITTLYGSMFANMFLTPMANKLRIRHAEEMLCKEIVVEGVLAIQSGDNPKHIEERLLAYLNTSERGNTEGGDGEEGAAEGGKKAKKAKKGKKGAEAAEE